MKIYVRSERVLSYFINDTGALFYFATTPCFLYLLSKKLIRNYLNCTCFFST